MGKLDPCSDFYFDHACYRKLKNNPIVWTIEANEAEILQNRLEVLLLHSFLQKGKHSNL